MFGISCMEVSGNSSKAWILRIAALIIGCVLMTTSGPVLGMTSYTNAYKATFNLTQTQVEWSISVAVVGHTLGFHVQWLQYNLGPRLTGLTAGGLLALGTGLLYSSTLAPNFYHDNSWLLHIYFFIFGSGCVTAMMIAMGVIPYNFREKHQGKVIGVLDTFYNLGTATTALIYNAAFANGHYVDPEEQNLQGFFLCQVVTWAVIGLLSGIFLASVPPEDKNEPEEEVEGKMLDENYLQTEAEKAELEKEKSESSCDMEQLKAYSITGLQAFKQPEYLAFLWFFCIFGGSQTMLFNNIGTMLYSTNNSGYIYFFTVFSACMCALGAFVLSTASDLLPKVPRILFIAVWAILQWIGKFFFMFYMDNIYVYGMYITILGISDGATWTVGQIIISELWGQYHFTRNLSIYFLGAAFSNALFQYLLGFFYDQHIPVDLREQGERDCFGVECFTNINILGIVTEFTGLLCLVYLIWRHNKSYCNRPREAMQQSEKTPLIVMKETADVYY